MDVRALNHEDCASDLEDVPDTQRVKRTLLTFGAEAKPGAICRAHICKVKANFLLVGSWGASGLLVADLGVVIAHLRVFLHAERVLLVTSDCKARLVDGNHPVAGGTLEYMQLAHSLLGSENNFELRKSHLEHHIGRECYFLPHHNEGAGCRPDVTQVEISQVAIAGGRSSLGLSTRFYVLYFAVAPTDETL